MFARPATLIMTAVATLLSSDASAAEPDPTRSLPDTSSPASSSSDPAGPPTIAPTPAGAAMNTGPGRENTVENTRDNLSRTVREANKLDEESIWDYFTPAILVTYFPAEVVRDARIENGAVRVRKEGQWSAGLGFQAYHPFTETTWVRSSDGGKTWKNYSQVGFGPFVGVTFSSEEVIDIVSFGFAFAHKRESIGMRFGVAVAIDPDASYLGAEFKRNQTALEGATSVELEEKGAIGIQIMASFTPGF